MPGPIDLSHRAGLVTGAASGIGRASAVALAAAGAQVLVTDLPAQEAAGRETVRLALQAADDPAVEVAWAPLDVTDGQQWDEVVAETVRRFGALDFAHNNAGMGLVAALHETTADDLARCLTVNLTGVFLGMRAQLSVMLPAGGGAIVNTASLAGLKGLQLGSAYSASKHAVVGLTRSAAVEYAQQGIRVNAICPAAVHTSMTAALPTELKEHIVSPQAMKRFAEPTEVGGAVAWLCSSSSSFLTGVALPVDGGAMAT